MSVEHTILGLFTFICLYSVAWMILTDTPTCDTIPTQTPTPQTNEIKDEPTQTPTQPLPKEQTEIETIEGAFSQIGEISIQNSIYESHYVCWGYTREFVKYNPRWAGLILGQGPAFGKCPHSVAYMRRDNNSAYVHDAWGGDTFVLEFTEDGNFTMWNNIENKTKAFDTRNAEWLSKFDHFHFMAKNQTISQIAITQDNRLKFIRGEI